MPPAAQVISLAQLCVLRPSVSTAHFRASRWTPRPGGSPFTSAVAPNLHTATDMAAHSPPTLSHISLNPSILVVDDDPKIRELVSDLLGMQGYDVYTATNGVEALEFLERRTPRLVVLDIRMPVLDGWGFARALQEQRTALPMLVLSGAVDARRCASEIGAAGFVSKPFDVDDLVHAVERFSLPGTRPPTATRVSPLFEKPIHRVRAARRL